MTLQREVKPCMTAESIRTVVGQLAAEMKRTFGKNLKRVILYGSCARGDFSSDSDIDVMILLDIPQEDLSVARRKVMDAADKLDWDYDVVLTPVVQTYQNFDRYRKASVFYQNIEKEGVLVA